MKKVTFTDEQAKVIIAILMDEFMEKLGVKALTLLQDAKLIVKMAEVFEGLTQEEMSERLTNNMEALAKELNL